MTTPIPADDFIQRPAAGPEHDAFVAVTPDVRSICAWSCVPIIATLSSTASSAWEWAEIRGVVGTAVETHPGELLDK